MELLQLFDKEKNKIAGLINYKDLCIESVLDTGDKTLSFSYAPKEKFYDLIEEEGYIKTKKQEYVIKSKDINGDYTSFKCVLNLEELEGLIHPRFESVEQTITNALNLAIVGTGWTVKDNTLKKKRTVRCTNKSALDIVKQIKKTYRVDIVFNTLGKKIEVYEHLGENKGTYFIDSLNLTSLQVQSDSYKYATRIIAEGKNGLTFEDINGGKNYVENYQYSNKIKTIYWKDERYTIKENLLADAKAKLEELSKPFRAYHVSVLNLADLNPKYKNILDYRLGDTITLISKNNRVKDKQRIVKTVEWPENHEKDSVDLANATLSFEDVQQENEETTDTVNNITSDNGTLDSNAIEDNSIKTTKIEDFEANVLKVTKLDVINANIENLHANKADIQDLNAIKATVGQLEATKANITQLNATNAEISKLNALKANITDLNAANGKINVLESKTASIDNLLAGNLTADNFKANSITAGSGIIADGAIGSAQISSLSVNKLEAGDITTSKHRIVSADGTIEIVGNQILINRNNVNRVILGEYRKPDNTTDYGLLIRGKDGKTVMFDSDGVHNAGITDGAIDNNKVADNANISGNKLDINSVIREVNNNGTETIKGTKVTVGDRTLDVELSTQKNTIKEHSKELSSQKATIQALDSAIKLKVDSQTFTQSTNTINNNINRAKEEAINSANSNTTNAINNIQIGGRNLAQLTSPKEYTAFTGKENDCQMPYEILLETLNVGDTITISFVFSYENLVTVPGRNDYFIRIQGSGDVVGWSDGAFPFLNISDKIKWGNGHSGSFKVIYNAPITSNVKKNTKWYSNFRMDCIQSGKVSVKEFMVEYGTKASAYTPAPEDLKNYADEVAKAKAELAKAQAIADSDGKITEEEKKRIKQAEDNLNIAIAKANEAENKAREYADAKKIEAINKASADAALKAAEALNNAKAFTTAEINTTNSNLHKATAEINILKGQIESKVSQSDIDKSISSIQLGGRNYVRYSNFPYLVPGTNNIKGWNFWGDISVFFNQGNPNYNITGVAYLAAIKGGGIWQEIKSDLIKPNQDYTLSLILGQEENVRDCPCYIEFWNNDVKIKAICLFSNTGYLELKRRSYTFKTINEPYTSIRLVFVHNGSPNGNGCLLQLGLIKLEKGNKAGDWTPAPEDANQLIVDNIKVVTDKITTVESTLVQKTNSIEAGVRDLNSTTQTITTNVSNINRDLSNKINSNLDEAKNFATDVATNKANTAKQEAIVGARNIPDTRNDNQSPGWYIEHYPKQLINEFKNANVIGITGTTYGILETKVPWGDSSGGFPVQTFRSNNTPTYQRRGLNSTNWSAWEQIEDTQGSQAKANDALNNAKVYTNAEITTVNTKVHNVESNLNILKEKIESKVSQSDIDKSIQEIKIGGRNLIVNSDTLQNLFSPLSGYVGTREVINDEYALCKKDVVFKCTHAGTGFHLPLFTKNSNRIGKTYTWSFWAKCSVNKSGTIGHESNGQTQVEFTTEWKKFSHTWLFGDCTYSSFTFYIGWNAGEILYIRDFKIEEGTKATDWTPAPEDVNQLVVDSIRVVDTKISDVSSKITQLKDSVTIDINSINSKTHTIETTLGGKASKQEVTEVNNRVATIKANLDSITQRVSSTESKTQTLETNLNGKASKQEVNNVSSKVVSLEANLNGITNRVSSTESRINTLNGQVQNAATKHELTEFKQSTKDFQWKVEQGLAGNNLLKNSGFLNGYSHFYITEYKWNGVNSSVNVWGDSSEWVMTGTNALVIRGTNGSYGSYGVRQDQIKLKPNTTYTLSGYAAVHRGTWRISLAQNDWGWIASSRGKSSGGKNPNNWDRFSITFTTGPAYDYLTNCKLDLMLEEAQNDAYVWFTNLVLNEGSIADKWQQFNNELYTSDMSFDTNGLYCSFSDGSHSSMSKDGFEWYNAGTGHSYHALAYVTSFGVPAGNPGRAYVRLPVEFTKRRKSLKWTVALRGYYYSTSGDFFPMHVHVSGTEEYEENGILVCPIEGYCKIQNAQNSGDIQFRPVTAMLIAVA